MKGMAVETYGRTLATTSTTVELELASPAGAMSRQARISKGGVFRYSLTRDWNEPGVVGKQVCFIGLNPSTADGTQDDPTIRRCIGFASSWGFRHLIMVNLFAYRSTKPKYLLTAKDPVGPENDAFISDAVRHSSLVVGAWGGHELAVERVRQLSSANVLGDYAVLGLTKSGQPRHPLYMKGSCIPLSRHGDEYRFEA